jgi:hypothetical protein
VTKFTYFYIKLPLFILQNVERGGGMPFLSGSAFRETNVDKQKLSQVQSCQKDDFALLVTSCYVKSETCCKVLANLLQGLQNQQTWCMLFQQAWHMFFAKSCRNLSDNLLREVWCTQYSIRFVWTTLLWGWYIHLVTFLQNDNNK